MIFNKWWWVEETAPFALEDHPKIVSSGMVQSLGLLVNLFLIGDRLEG